MTHDEFLDKTRAELERMRLAAAKDFAYNMRQADVARKYGVTRTTASRWARRLARGGVDALKRGAATGRPPHLTPDQLLEVRDMYCAEPYTIARLAFEIEEKFGVHYHPDHVGRILHKQLGFPPFTRAAKAARAAS